jgi:hypothetical protein
MGYGDTDEEGDAEEPRADGCGCGSECGCKTDEPTDTED